MAANSEENPNPIVELHATGAVTYMNPAAMAAFPDLPSMRWQHPVLSGLPEIMNALRDNGDPSARREIRAGGNVYEQIITVTKGSDFVRVWMNDVTLRKRNEATLEMANMSLQKLVKDLQQSQRQLYGTESQLIQAEKMGAIGQLASGIVHEVKNPLAILLKGVSYLERECGPPAQGQLAQVLRMMKDAIMRADQIVRDLLDFARPAPLDLRSAPIQSVLDAALELVQEQLSTGHIKIVKEIDPGVTPVLLDESRMKQALINLILNAFQAMPSGGTLTIRAYPKTLTQRGGSVGDRSTDVFRVGQTVLACELVDTGQGIPAEALSKVFDPFFTSKAPGEGTGLGLAVTKTIIEQHKGCIEIASKPERGTQVTVLLPMVALRNR